MTESELRNLLEKRATLLRTIVDSPRDKPQLTEELDVSRSTISRGLNAFAEHDCIEKRNGKYHPTKTGEILLERYDEYVTSVRYLSEAAEIVNGLPQQVSISNEFIRGSETFSSDPQIPGVALEASHEILHSSDELRGLAPFALPSYPQMIHKAVEEDDLTAEIIIERKIIEILRETQTEIIASLEQSENATFLISENPLPYAVWIMESDAHEYAGVTVYEDGGVKGVLINNREPAVDWARDRYDDFRTRATPLD